MNRMECVRMSVEEDNGRERGEEKQEKNGNRKEYGNKEENRIEGENRIKEWLVEERGRRGKESCVKWNRMKDGKRREWEREDVERNEWEE